MSKITVGSKVKIHPRHIDRVSKYGYTRDKVYEVISTNPFWSSAKVVNDFGEESSLDTERLVLVEKEDATEKEPV